jgi:hypothetical protein
MLAARFGLSLSNVKSILGRRSWKHTDFPRPPPGLRIFEAQQEWGAAGCSDGTQRASDLVLKVTQCFSENSRRLAPV